MANFWDDDQQQDDGRQWPIPDPDKLGPQDENNRIALPQENSTPGWPGRLESNGSSASLAPSALAQPSAPAPSPAMSTGSDGNQGYYRPDGGWQSVPSSSAAPASNSMTSSAAGGHPSLPEGWSIGSDGNPGHYRPDGGWQSVPWDQVPGASSGGGGQAPAAPAQPANPAGGLIEEMLRRQREQDAKNAEVEAAQRKRLLELLGTDTNAASIDDPDLKPQADAYRLAQHRAMQQQRQMLAERAAATGLNSGGAGSGAFDTGLQGIAEQAGEKSAAFNADLVGRKLSERKAQLMQGLQLADALGARNEANALQSQLAAIDAALRQTALSMSDNHFYDQLGFNYSNLLMGANRDALMGMLG